MSLRWRPSPKNPEAWQHLWWCAQGRCQGPYCQDQPAWSLALEECHVDQKQAGQLQGEPVPNGRILCRRCYILHARRCQVGLIVSALCDGLIGPDWRSFVWED